MKARFSVWRVGVVTVVAVAVIVAAAWWLGYLQPVGLYRPANALMVIEPYKYAGTWVFDDKRVGLEQEPFIAGIPELMDGMTKNIPGAEKGFRLIFSTQEFPGYDLKMTWARAERGGNWYLCESVGKEGWLCPALFRYYKEAPKNIYVKAEAK